VDQVHALVQGVMDDPGRRRRVGPGPEGVRTQTVHGDPQARTAKQAIFHVPAPSLPLSFENLRPTACEPGPPGRHGSRPPLIGWHRTPVWDRGGKATCRNDAGATPGGAGRAAPAVGTC